MPDPSRSGTKLRNSRLDTMWPGGSCRDRVNPRFRSKLIQSFSFRATRIISLFCAFKPRYVGTRNGWRQERCGAILKTCDRSEERRVGKECRSRDEQDNQT